MNPRALALGLVAAAVRGRHPEAAEAAAADARILVASIETPFEAGEVLSALAGLAGGCLLFAAGSGELDPDEVVRALALSAAGE